MQTGPTLTDLPARTIARWVCLRALRDAERAVARIRDEKDATALHDFRVALRRLRVALRAFRPVLGGLGRRRYLRAIEELLSATGGGRDYEAQIAWIDRLLSDYPAASSECEPFRSELEDARSAEIERVNGEARRGLSRLARSLRPGLESYRVSVRPGKLSPVVGTAEILHPAIVRESATLRERLAELNSVVGVNGAHRARVAAKRLRYLLEPFEAEIVGGDRIIRELRELQSVLGDLHDLDILAERVGRAAAGTSTVGGGIRLLARRLRTRRDEVAKTVVDHWLGERKDALLTAVQEAATALAGTDDIEIERKFLLSGMPQLPEDCERLEIEQGWFGLRFPERLRRVRSETGTSCFRAIKHGAGMRRLELEESIPNRLFDTLWSLTEGRRVRKDRFRVSEGDACWEIDRFVDRDLVLAEIELPSEDHPVVPPRWLEPHIVREVTDEPAYLNVNLAR